MVRFLNDNWNKINTREELVKLLKGYKGILANNMIDYLNSLIELEFSVIKEYIKDDDRKALSELEIYKRIAIYNIYNRVQNLFNQQNGEFIIYGNNDGYEGLNVSAKLSDRNVKLFDFDYKEIHSSGWNTPRVPSGFKTLNIGDISLFQTLESKELREAELDKVMTTLERLYDERNPYSSRRGVIGGPGSNWEFDHAMDIEEYEKKFIELDSKKELSDEDKREIEITSQIHNLLLEDYGLTNKDFEEENKLAFASSESLLKKTLVKKQPNLTITNHIKYM